MEVKKEKNKKDLEQAETDRQRAKRDSGRNEGMECEY